MRFQHRRRSEDLGEKWRACCRCGATATDYDIDFTACTVAPTVGETITGVTSGYVGTVSSVYKRNGTYAGGDATGTITLTAAPTGYYTDGEYLTGSTSGASFVVCRTYVPRHYGREYPESMLAEYNGREYCPEHFAALKHTFEDESKIELEEIDTGAMK